METEAIIIGAGISGLAAAKCMQEVGFKVLVLERTGDVGGLWVYKEKKYGVMKFTHINVSKDNYCFSDFPVPEDCPDYLHNSELLDYVEKYTEHYGVDKLIRFNRNVCSVVRTEDQKWEIDVEIVTEDAQGVITTTDKKEKYICKFLAIASGHHAKPIYPNFPGLGEFKGDAIHSVDYNDADYNGVSGKKVVVVGIGNSAVDVACNAASTGRCKPVYISSRSGAWIVPNYIFGSPTDHFACRFFLSLPWRLGSFIFENILKLVHGPQNKWGLYPKMNILQTQPTVSPTLVHHIQRGEIKIVPNIKKIDGKKITFEDGQTTDADKLILCTGYAMDLPFLEDDIKRNVVNESENSIKLFKNVFAPEVGHTLAFIGFVQPASGGVLTMSETQARWWAQLCRNNIILPMKNEMKLAIDKEMEYVRKRWFSSKRHTIQKDPLIYNDDIASLFGAKPEIGKLPHLAWRLLLGSCGASQWRLQGPGKWNKAEEQVKKVPVTSFLLYGSLISLVLLFVLFYYMFCWVFNM